MCRMLLLIYFLFINRNTTLLWQILTGLLIFLNSQLATLCRMRTAIKINGNNTNNKVINRDDVKLMQNKNQRNLIFLSTSCLSKRWILFPRSWRHHFRLRRSTSWSRPTRSVSSPQLGPAEPASSGSSSACSKRGWSSALRGGARTSARTSSAWPPRPGWLAGSGPGPAASGPSLRQPRRPQGWVRRRPARSRGRFGAPGPESGAWSGCCASHASVVPSRLHRDWIRFLKKKIIIFLFLFINFCN